MLTQEPREWTKSEDELEPSMPTGDGVSSSNAEALSGRLPKIVPFRELCRCGDEVWIENEGQLYRLRRTRQGKLILTK
jgi:hemin uptake protein HemP